MTTNTVQAKPKQRSMAPEKSDAKKGQHGQDVWLTVKAVADAQHADYLRNLVQELSVTLAFWGVAYLGMVAGLCYCYKVGGRALWLPPGFIVVTGCVITLVTFTADLHKVKTGLFEIFAQNRLYRKKCRDNRFGIKDLYNSPEKQAIWRAYVDILQVFDIGKNTVDCNTAIVRSKQPLFRFDVVTDGENIGSKLFNMAVMLANNEKWKDDKDGRLAELKRFIRVLEQEKNVSLRLRLFYENAETDIGGIKTECALLLETIARYHKELAGTVYEFHQDIPPEPVEYSFAKWLEYKNALECVADRLCLGLLKQK